MKKIPTLFIREFEGNHIARTTREVTPGLEYIVSGEGIATVKIDGSCTAIIHGEFYKRYDAKQGKKIPEGAIKCQEEADPITGHLPCWVKCDGNNPSDKWFIEAYNNTIESNELEDGTYEAIGPHFQRNPHKLEKDILIKHGIEVIELPDHSYETIKDYLENHYIEGLVFWKDGEPRCKIKRSDFGFPWNTVE